MKRSRRSDGARLGREQWVAAAIEALGRGGLAAVKVEPLARALGVTKGSFYWHFANRGALVEAVLDAFETQATEGVIERLEQIADPRERLVALIKEASDPATISIEVALASSAAAGHPAVAPRYRAVSARRQAYVVELYRQLGLHADEAERWGTATYTWFLGLLQRLAIEGAAPDPEGVRREAALVVERLVPRG